MSTTLIIVLLVVITFLNSFVIIPEYHFGVMSILGWRMRGEWGILKEGPHLLIPFISSFELISLELVKKDIKFSFTTLDRLTLSVEGVFQYRPDPKVWFPRGHPDEGRSVFVTVSEEAIFAGVVETVEARIGGLGGKYPHEKFIENRQALGDIINFSLRLKTPPHHMHQLGSSDPNPMNPNEPFCGQVDCEYRDPVEAGQLIDFYDKHWPQIAMLKADEESFYKSHSEIERRYGISVRAFDLGNVMFTPETQQALEEKQQAEARGKAADQRIGIARRFVEEVKTSPQTAVDEADLLMDPKVAKEILSIQGEAGIVGGILGSLARRGGA